MKSEGRGKEYLESFTAGPGYKELYSKKEKTNKKSKKIKNIKLNHTEEGYFHRNKL